MDEKEIAAQIQNTTGASLGGQASSATKIMKSRQANQNPPATPTPKPLTTPEGTLFHSTQAPKSEPVVELNDPVGHPDSVVIDSTQREWQQFEGGLPGERVNANIRPLGSDDDVNEFYLETRSRFYPVAEYKIDAPWLLEGANVRTDSTDPAKIAFQIATRYQGIDADKFIGYDRIPEYAGVPWIQAGINEILYSGGKNIQNLGLDAVARSSKKKAERDAFVEQFKGYEAEIGPMGTFYSAVLGPDAPSEMTDDEVKGVAISSGLIDANNTAALDDVVNRYKAVRNSGKTAYENTYKEWRNDPGWFGKYLNRLEYDRADEKDSRGARIFATAGGFIGSKALPWLAAGATALATAGAGAGPAAAAAAAATAGGIAGAGMGYADAISTVDHAINDLGMGYDDAMDVFWKDAAQKTVSEAALGALSGVLQTAVVGTAIARGASAARAALYGAAAATGFEAATGGATEILQDRVTEALLGNRPWETVLDTNMTKEEWDLIYAALLTSWMGGGATYRGMRRAAQNRIDDQNAKVASFMDYVGKVKDVLTQNGMEDTSAVDFMANYIIRNGESNLQNDIRSVMQGFVDRAENIDPDTLERARQDLANMDSDEGMQAAFDRLSQNIDERLTNIENTSERNLVKGAVLGTAMMLSYFSGDPYNAFNTVMAPERINSLSRRLANEYNRDNRVGAYTTNETGGTYWVRPDSNLPRFLSIVAHEMSHYQDSMLAGKIDPNLLAEFTDFYLNEINFAYSDMTSFRSHIQDLERFFSSEGPNANANGAVNYEGNSRAMSEARATAVQTAIQDTAPKDLTQGTSSDEIARLYDRAAQFLGVRGKAADYIRAVNFLLNAVNSVSPTENAVQQYLQAQADYVKKNSSAIKAVIKRAGGPEEFRAVVSEYLKGNRDIKWKGMDGKTVEELASLANGPMDAEAFQELSRVVGEDNKPDFVQLAQRQFASLADDSKEYAEDMARVAASTEEQIAATRIAADIELGLAAPEEQEIESNDTVRKITEDEYSILEQESKGDTTNAEEEVVTKADYVSSEEVTLPEYPEAPHVKQETQETIRNLDESGVKEFLQTTLKRIQDTEEGLGPLHWSAEQGKQVHYNRYNLPESVDWRFKDNKKTQLRYYNEIVSLLKYRQSILDIQKKLAEENREDNDGTLFATSTPPVYDDNYIESLMAAAMENRATNNGRRRRFVDVLASKVANKTATEDQKAAYYAYRIVDMAEAETKKAVGGIEVYEDRRVADKNLLSAYDESISTLEGIFEKTQDKRLKNWIYGNNGVWEFSDPVLDAKNNAVVDKNGNPVVRHRRVLATLASMKAKRDTLAAKLDSQDVAVENAEENFVPEVMPMTTFQIASKKRNFDPLTYSMRTPMSRFSIINSFTSFPYDDYLDLKVNAVAKGWRPFAFDTSGITKDMDTDLVFRTKLLPQLENRSQQKEPRILDMLDAYKLAIDLTSFGYSDETRRFLNYPTTHVPFGPEHVIIDNSEEMNNQRNTYKAQGYEEVKTKYALRNLMPGDEIAFTSGKYSNGTPYFNVKAYNVVRRMYTSHGKLFYILRREFDLNNAKGKTDGQVRSTLAYEVITNPDELYKLNVLRRPVSKQTEEQISYLKDLNILYDKVLDSAEDQGNTKSKGNLLRASLSKDTPYRMAGEEEADLGEIASMTGISTLTREHNDTNVPASERERYLEAAYDFEFKVLQRYGRNSEEYKLVSSLAQNITSDDDIAPNTLYSTIIDNTAIEFDDGNVVYATQDLSQDKEYDLMTFADLTPAERADVLAQAEEIISKSAPKEPEYTFRFAARNINVRGESYDKVFNETEDAIMNSKLKGNTFDKVAVFIARQLGLESMLDASLLKKAGGTGFSKYFGFVETRNLASQESADYDAMFNKMSSDVFGSRAAYKKYRNSVVGIEQDAIVNGVPAKISKGEVIGLYLANQNPTQKPLLSKYNNLSELLATLTDEDKKFANDVVLPFLARIRGLSTIIHPRTGEVIYQDPTPEGYVPARLFSEVSKKTWDVREQIPSPVSEVVSRQEPIMVLDIFAGLRRETARFAFSRSGYTKKANVLKTILDPTTIDKSRFSGYNAATDSFDDEASNELYKSYVDRAQKMNRELFKKIGSQNYKWLLRNLEREAAGTNVRMNLGEESFMKTFARFGRSAIAASLSFSGLQAAQNFTGNYTMMYGIDPKRSMTAHVTTKLVDAVVHSRDAIKQALKVPAIKNRLIQAGFSEHSERLMDKNVDSFLDEVEQMISKHNIKGAKHINSVLSVIQQISDIGTKYGLATNTLPDFLGIAYGLYGQYDEILKRNNGNSNLANREIGKIVDKRISSANAATKGEITLWANKNGLGGLFAYQGDQLRKWAIIANSAISLIHYSDDKALKKQAYADLRAVVTSMAVYIAIKSGAIGMGIKMATGKELDDAEKEFLYDSIVQEVIGQFLGMTQATNILVSPLEKVISDGTPFSPSFPQTSYASRMISHIRKGEYWDALMTSTALTGVFPFMSRLASVIEGVVLQFHPEPLAREVGRKQMAGRTQNTALKMVGATKKKEPKDDDEEKKPRKRLKKLDI